MRSSGGQVDVAKTDEYAQVIIQGLRVKKSTVRRTEVQRLGGKDIEQGGHHVEPFDLIGGLSEA